MSFLITGADGMVGREIDTALHRVGYPRTAAGRATLDITDFEACRRTLDRLRPTAVFHCAGWTDVDGAEGNPDAAYQANALGALHVAAACAAVGAWMVHFSSDFVFDGEKGNAYDEFDAVNPISVYGRTKEAGERFVRQTLPDRHIIVRTAYVFGPTGRNIVKNIATAAHARPVLRFVEDQIVTPTHTADLARVAIRLLVEDPLPGTYHVASSTACSLLEFARAVVTGVGLQTPVEPIRFDEYVAQVRPPARRPRISALERRMLRLRDRDDLPGWKEALTTFLERDEVV